MLFALLGCSGAGVEVNRSDDQESSESSEPIEWGECTDEVAADSAVECATIEVPLDYEQPDSDSIEIALVRVPAQTGRQGAVLFNFGGPGASGFDPIAINGEYLQGELGLEQFDLIGFDPRGVDRSNGIRCLDDEDMDAYLNDDSDDLPSFDEACREAYGDTLRHYSTENTARDMDEIRRGLGDAQISFLGISYGTYLGAVYATLFPERVRAMVLDSAYAPTGDTVEEQYLTQLVGFEEAFDTWVDWCETTDDCPFRADDVGERWDDLMDSLDVDPITLDDGREVNAIVMDTATGASLYAESDWPVLAVALADAERGDGDALMAIADTYNGRNADGTYDTLFQSFDVIRCASGIVTQPAEDPEALLAEIRERAPRFGAEITLDDLVAGDGEDLDGCADLTGVVEPVEMRYEGDAPILVVGGENDPATPIRWAEEMTEAMGPSARLLRYTGEGHGQLLVSSCVTELEAATLADLELPDQGSSCDPDPVVERPDWFDDIPVPSGVSDVVVLPALTAALGLPDTAGYAEVRLTDLELERAASLIESALEGAGFENFGRVDIGIDGTIDVNFLAPNGDILIVLLLAPEAFETDDLASAAATVPEGRTVVMYVYLAE